MRQAAYSVDQRQRAYLDVLLLRAAWRAAQDAEAQVAHWLLDGLATQADLLVARERTRLAKRALTHAHRRYTREVNHTAAVLLRDRKG